MPLNKLLAFISIILFVTSCVKPSTQYPGLTPEEIVAEQVIQKKLATDQKNSISYNKVNSQSRLQVVAPKILKAGGGLCQQIGKQNNGCVYDFQIEKSDQINAYADGKKIVITEGMMKFTKNNDELALVLGHEFAHNMMGHIAARQQNVGVGTMFGTLLDSLAVSQGINTNGIFSNLGTYAGTLKYSQEFEKEADYVGLYITKLAGFNITNSPEFWRRMSIKDQKSIYTASTHPTNPERYIGLGKAIREINLKKSNGSRLVPNIKPAK